MLGVAICGPHAPDLIPGGKCCCRWRWTQRPWTLTRYPHPTLGEGVMEAAATALGRATCAANR